jgi:hypothetical protein
MIPRMPLWLYLRAVEHLARVAVVLLRPCPFDVPVIPGPDSTRPPS